MAFDQIVATVARHFDDDEWLLALIETMNEEELAQVQRVIAVAADKPEHDCLKNLHLAVYACQEDIPYNSLEGFEATTAAGVFPMLYDFWAPEIGTFYEMCETFEPAPREGFHDPVVSDIPTLSIGQG